MSNLDELLKQREDLDKQIAMLQKKEFYKDNIEVILQPSCSGRTANAINKCGWRLNDLLLREGKLNESQFNNLNFMICEVIRLYFEEFYKSETKEDKPRI